MSLEDNKAIIRQLFERVVNHQELELADKTVSLDYIDHSARPGSVAKGPDSIRDFVTRQRAAFPDAHVTIEDILAEGDRVAVRINMTGTPVAGGPPVRFRGSVWWRLADGKVKERWGGAFGREAVD
jgi:predicted SnoaL-like aldol condensation-catalyzing enzyme